MNVSREVIVDLLPLYLADEASPESQALVHEHLEGDPELARLARQMKERLKSPPPAAVNPDAEALAYRDAKRQIANRVLLLASVIAFGLMVIGGAALMGAIFMLGR